MGCTGSSSKGSQGAGVARVEEPSALPVLTEVSPEERALLQLKAIFDGVDKSCDGDVCKKALAAALGKDPSLGVLVKTAGFDQDYNVLEALPTCKQGRITWVEFQSNLRKTVVVDASADGNAVVVESRVEDTAAEDAMDLAQKVAASLVLGLVQQEEFQQQEEQPTRQQQLPSVNIDGAVSQGGFWCCSC